jgi:hypothetical protein
VIDPEHFGVSIGYSARPLSDQQRASAVARGRSGRPAPPIPESLTALRSTLEQFIDVGFSKFVVRPSFVDTTWTEEITMLADAVGDLQT